MKKNWREVVRREYGRIATRGGSCCGPVSSCCGAAKPNSVAKAVGYDQRELATLPEGANMGLSCGNPGAIARLKPGETVLDLGCGGGFDVFLAAQKVGSTGHVIGVDMTPEMVAKARKNAEAFRQRTGLDNVEFRLGEIEHLPVADNSVDVVISNCVINLSPDKPQVWKEIQRVLKPGGRVAISDLALLKPLPARVKKSVEALVGCVAGAILVEETRRLARVAGLINIRLTKKPQYVKMMEEWNDPLYRAIKKALPKSRQLADYVTSLYVEACKPIPASGVKQARSTYCCAG